MAAAIPQKIIQNGHFTDCHCHLLPGLDDGPVDIVETLEIARILSAAGFLTVFCTPHLQRWTYDNKPEQIVKQIQHLQETLDAKGVVIKVHASIEYYLDEYLMDMLDKPLCIGQNKILMEIYRHVSPEVLSDTAYQIISRKKLFPIIAHPERHDLFDIGKGYSDSKNFLANVWSWFTKKHARTNRNVQSYFADSDHILYTLRNMGCLFQGNIGSFSGIYGDRVKTRALRLLAMGFYDRLGTDAHRSKKLAEYLEKGMKIVAQEIGTEGLNALLQPIEVPVRGGS